MALRKNKIKLELRPANQKPLLCNIKLYFFPLAPCLKSTQMRDYLHEHREYLLTSKSIFTFTCMLNTEYLCRGRHLCWCSVPLCLPQAPAHLRAAWSRSSVLPGGSVGRGMGNPQEPEPLLLQLPRTARERNRESKLGSQRCHLAHVALRRTRSQFKVGCFLTFFRNFQ